jgi:hypothetical protein
MDEKNRFDAYMVLAEFWRSRRDARYQALLRVSLALWASLGAGTIYIKVRPPEFLLVAFLALLMVGHASFIWVEILRNWYDTKMSFYYIDHAEKVLFEAVTVRAKPADVWKMSFKDRMIKRPASEFWTLAQWAMPTALLVLVAYFQIGR